MHLSVSVKLLGRCLTVCLHWWSAREALLFADPCCTLILHCYCIPTKLQMGLTSLFTAYTRCMQVLPLLLRTCAVIRTCAAGGTAYPYGACHCLCYCRPVSQRDCLPTLAFHVNVYALITPPPWSILSLFQPPLERSPSVVTVVTLASTYCSFPACGDRQEFRESPFVRPERASLSFAFLLYLPPIMARGPSSEREIHRRPSDHLPFLSFAHLYGARPKRASLSLPFCANCPRYGARPVLGASAPQAA